jgi:hypothetical protein
LAEIKVVSGKVVGSAASALRIAMRGDRRAAR